MSCQMQEFSFSNDILGKHLDRAIINKMQFSHSLHPIEVFPERKWQHLHPTKVKHYHSFGYEIRNWHLKPLLSITFHFHLDIQRPWLGANYTLEK